MKELHEGHDHGYSHEHCHHDHAHGHDHLHEHDHSHEHRDHDHAHGSAPDLAKAAALLEYMTDHNRQHASEVGDLAHYFYHAGKENAAKLLEDAVEDFATGSEKLAEALALIKGDK